MRKSIHNILWILLRFKLMAAILLWVFNVSAQGTMPLGAGHGNLTVGGELRTFSFVASEHGGEVSGIANFKNRALNDHEMVDINCIQDFPNGIRVFAGIIDNPDNPNRHLRRGAFFARDNGEGEMDHPDELALVIAFGPNFPETCPNLSEPFPGFLESMLNDIEGGNIQIWN